MSGESKSNPEYQSVGSGPKRRKLSNDSNTSKSPVSLSTPQSPAKLSSSAVEDAEPPRSEKTADAEKVKDLAETEVKDKEAEPESASLEKSQKTPQQASPKPVFGAASVFGSTSIFEKMKSRSNVFDTPAASDSEAKDAEKGDKKALFSSTSLGTPESQNKTPALKTASTSSFGSFGGSFGANSVFSNALQKASQKKSFLDEPEENAAEMASPQTTQQYKQVDLQETTVSTGEENEKSVFNTKSKLFELNFAKLSDGWKERGVGPLHLNKSLGEKPSARLVMRANGLLRVILNYAIRPETELIKGLEASLNPGKFLRMNAAIDGHPVQYMLKFGSEALRDELFDQVEKLKAELKDAGETGGTKEVNTPKRTQATGFRFIDTQASPGAHTDVDSDNEKKSHA